MFCEHVEHHVYIAEMWAISCLERYMTFTIYKTSIPATSMVEYATLFSMGKHFSVVYIQQDETLLVRYTSLLRMRHITGHM